MTSTTQAPDLTHLHPLIERYKVSGRVSPLGLVRAFVLATLLGLFIGWLSHFIGRFLYLILLHPMLVAAALAGLNFALTRSGKIRNMWVSGFIGVWMGGVSYLTFWYADYLYFYQDLGLLDLFRMLFQGDLGQLIAYEVNQSLFGEFLQESAEAGMWLSSTSSSNSEVNVGPIITKVYWGIEAALILLVPITGGLSQASQPFCEKDNDWYGFEQRIGSVPADNKWTAVQLAKQRDVTKLNDLIIQTRGSAVLPKFNITLQACDKCSESVGVLNIYLETMQQDGKTANQQVASVILNPYQTQKIFRP
ncbi:MAG: hypothetical protein AAGD96_08925 [Chloroflexota bacterium]